MTFDTVKGFSVSLSRFRSSPAFAVTTVTFAVYVDMFLEGMIIPILPELLTTRAHVEPNMLQNSLAGLVAIYNIATCICAPIAGYLADKWSNRKVPLLGGLVALAGTTALFMVARDLRLLFVARFLSGVSAAVVWAVGLALLVDTVGTKEIGSAMGWISIGISVGQTSGPLIGGIVYSKAGHYPTFVVAFALIAIDVVFRLLLREQKLPTGPIPQQTQDEPRQGEVVTSDESDERQPLLQRQGDGQAPQTALTFIKLLTYPDMLVSLIYVILTTGVLSGVESTLALHVQSQFNFGSFGAGMIYLAVVLCVFASPLVGSIYDRIGSAPISGTGFLLMALFSPLLAVPRSSDTTSLVLFFIFLFMVGLGITLVMTPEMAVISSFGERILSQNPDASGTQDATAKCTALMTLATSLGGIVGPVLVGPLQSRFGWLATTLCLGAMGLLGLVLLVCKAVYDRLKNRATK